MPMLHSINSLPIERISHDIRRRLFSIIFSKKFRRLIKLRTQNISGYSYQPFDHSKTIFIHIPKSAGVSISQSLYGCLSGGHTSVNEYKIVFTRAEFSSYFKFTFVRNPWDRLYSAFSFLKSGGFNSKDERWAKRHLTEMTFERFVMTQLSSQSIFEHVHFIPQYRFLDMHSLSRCPLDFIGYFENIEEDFKYISFFVKAEKTSLIHSNNTNKYEYASYLTVYSQDMIDIVAKIYNKDIEIFGYTFDNRSINAQIAMRDEIFNVQKKSGF